jgi:hypothetical protein
MCPNGEDLMHGKHDANDYDDTAEDFNESTAPLDPPPEPDVKDAIAEEEPCTKHDPCFVLDGDKVYKVRYLNQPFREFKTPASQNQLKQAVNILQYAIKQDISSNIVDHDPTSNASSIQIDSPITTLVKCEDHVFLCISEVNDIIHDSNYLEEISVDTLMEPSVFVHFNSYFLCPQMLKMTLIYSMIGAGLASVGTLCTHLVAVSSI